MAIAFPTFPLPTRSLAENHPIWEIPSNDVTIPIGYTRAVELRHLRYFVAVAEEQNVSRAAARLHVSQPPLSRQIRDLERELGVLLFKRTPKAISPTEAGRVFLMEARAILHRVDEAIGVAKAAASGKTGRVRVGYAASPSVEILPRALRTFKRSHPNVGVDLRNMTSRAILSGLHDGSLDVALVVTVSPSEFDGLIIENLRTYSMRVAMHPRHRLARRKRVPLREIAKEPLVTFSRLEHPEHPIFLARVFASQSRKPDIAEECDTATSLIAAVEAGRGVAVVFETMSRIAGGRLVLRPITPALQRYPVDIAYREGAGEATMAFVEAIRRTQRGPKNEGDLGAHPVSTSQKKSATTQPLPLMTGGVRA
jgi:LysR family transcriptional regulator, benzoate and cis,cis-muconate-responsive activator of ben and cat genes